MDEAQGESIVWTYSTLLKGYLPVSPQLCREKHSKHKRSKQNQIMIIKRKKNKMNHGTKNKNKRKLNLPPTYSPLFNQTHSAHSHGSVGVCGSRGVPRMQVKMEWWRGGQFTTPR